MADRLRVALVFHQHQPAGTLPTVFQDAAERAYARFANVKSFWKD